MTKTTSAIDPLREALEEIVGLTTYLRQGGPDPMDLQGLSDALDHATSLAHTALAVPDGIRMTNRSSPGTSALLPCPFCGSKAVDRREVDGFPMIYCSGDECFGLQTTARDFEDAVVQWNTRAGAAQAPAVKMPEWRDYAETIDEYIRKDGSRYSLALAALIEVLENVEAALSPVPSTEQRYPHGHPYKADAPFDPAAQEIMGVAVTSKDQP